MAFTLTYLIIAGLIGLGLGCLIGYFFGWEAGYSPMLSTLIDLRKELVSVRIRRAQHFADFEERAAADRARLDSLGTKVAAVLSNCGSAHAPVIGGADRPSQGTGLPVDVGHGPCRGSETVETASDDRQGLSERPAVHPSSECQACAAAREVCRRAIIRHSVSPVETAVESIRCPRHSGYYRADGVTPIGVSSRTDR